MKSALLLLVHGSPRAGANRPIERIAEDIRAKGDWDGVSIGFLDCNEPDIPTAIEECVAKGAERLVIVPCFLHAGNHVANDLPQLLNQAKTKYPALQIAMSDFLGSAPQITELLLKRASEICKTDEL